MADLDQLKQKYAPVIDTIQRFTPYGATVDDVSLDGERLVLKGTVPSTVVANRVWDHIKKVDPTTPTSSTRLPPRAAKPSPSRSSLAIPSPPSACSSTATPTSTLRSPKPTTSPTPTTFPSAPRSNSPSSASLFPAKIRGPHPSCTLRWMEPLRRLDRSSRSSRTHGTSCIYSVTTAILKDLP
jgi:hypothetical protein